MTNISVPVLYDNNDQYLASTLVGIDINSRVVGIESKPAFPTIPGYPGTFTDTLRVADPQKGTFYLPLTLQQYEEIVSAALQDPNKEITYVYTVGGSPVSSITDSRFLNVTFNAILVDNVPLNISTITYTPLTDSTITFADPIPPTAVLQFIYHNN